MGLWYEEWVFIREELREGVWLCYLSFPYALCTCIGDPSLSLQGRLGLISNLDIGRLCICTMANRTLDPFD